MGREMGWAAGMWFALAMLGCSAETSNEIAEFNAGSDDLHVGETSQALEQFVDRPAVAAIGVGIGVGGGGAQTRELWLFACKTDNVLYRRVKPDHSTDWQPTWTVASSIPCGGVPTASAWNALPQDEVEVFYRSTAGHLIEVFYGTDGSTQEVDLSVGLGLGGINGHPVVADMGTNHRLSVAVRDTSNRLKTLTFTPDLGWVIQSATNSAGQQVHADGLLTAMYTSQLSYLSSSLSGTYRVFTRAAWTAPYVAINSTIPNARGVLTFAYPAGSPLLVIGRDDFDRVTKSPIVPGQPWSFTLANSQKVASTPYMGASWSYDAARVHFQNTGIACLLRSGDCEVTTLWSLFNTQTVTHIYPTTGLRSAGTKPVNAGQFMSEYVFFASNNYRIHWVNMQSSEASFVPNFVDMGINVLIP
jgi:hypothetical protein